LGSGRKIRSYDLEFKLKVITFAKENSGEAAAREFGVDPKRVREWKKQEPDLRKNSVFLAELITSVLHPVVLICFQFKLCTYANFM
jgi:transposase-like protein